MLTLWRRHLRGCRHRHKGRMYRRCGCPIQVEGKVGEDRVRESLGKQLSWEQAQQIVLDARGRGYWKKLLAETRTPVVTIGHAIAEFMRDIELNRRLTESTIKKYRLMLGQLTAFLNERGIDEIKQVDASLLREFQATWTEIGARTAVKKLERVKAFFRFAHESGWIPDNSAKPLRGPSVKPAPKLPFEPEEMARIIKACRTVKLQAVTNEELLAFVLLLRHSGLRIGDASMLTSDRIKDNQLFLYTQKTGTHVWVPFPPEVADLVARVRPKKDRYLFTGPNSLRMETASDLWRRKLHRVFKAAGIESGTPHRFRHTFAIELLKGGVPIEDVSILLGHSSVKVTESHYSAWNQARQDLLRARVQKTWKTFGSIESGLAKSA